MTTRPRLARIARLPLGPRGAMLLLATAVIAVATVLVSNDISGHLATTATNEAVRSSTAVVRAFVDPLLAGVDIAHPDASTASAIDAELARLTASGQILRVKIWAPDGTIAFSDLPALRGRQFAVDDDLGDALAGKIGTSYSTAGDAENVFERGLADRFLSVYLPIRAGSGTAVIGAYEIYLDAAPIDAEIDATRREVLAISAFMALAVLGVLAGTLAGTSRLLDRQNRLLRERADRERALALGLRRSEERFRSLVQHSSDLIVVFSADQTVTYESPAMASVLGHAEAARLGRPLASLVHPDDLGAYAAFVEEVLRTPWRELLAEFRLHHADGTWRDVEAVARNLLLDPAVEGVVVNCRDVTQRRALERELTIQAFHDSLTGLANRALFLDRLEHALARSRRLSPAATLAVLFLDLDDFKTVNDSLGHAPGDALLAEVAGRFALACRPGDTVARLGGDEFAVILEDADEDVAAAVAERLLDGLAVPIELGGRTMRLRASVGIACSSADAATAGDLLRNADLAMYRAKGAGKARIEVFRPELLEASRTRLNLVADLEGAIRRGEFFLVYQPIVDLRSGAMVGVEALVRWRHPERGVVPPDAFIAVAEETGLIVAIDRWVLGEAARQAATWALDPATAGLDVSINVSGRHVGPDLVRDVGETVEATGVDPSRLLIELTETVLIDDPATATQTVRELRGLGVRLALDDFGTGYSSLSYLRTLPVDVLKLDRSFVRGSIGGRGDASILRAIIDLAATLELGIIAEGIEDPAQRDSVRAMGAQMGQGYLFSRPVSALEIERLARADGAASSAA